MCWVYKTTFDWQDRRLEQAPLGSWECAYSVDLVVELQSYDFDVETGYVELPKIFNRSYPSSYRLVLERDDQGNKSRIWYIDSRRAEIASLPTELPISDDQTVDSEGEELG